MNNSDILNSTALQLNYFFRLYTLSAKCSLWFSQQVIANALEYTAGAVRQLQKTGQVNNDTDYWTNPFHSSHRDRQTDRQTDIFPAFAVWLRSSLHLLSGRVSWSVRLRSAQLTGTVPASCVLTSLILRETCPIGRLKNNRQLTSYGQRMPTFKKLVEL